MSHLIVGPDPLPGPATTKDVWESVSPDHRIVWIGSNQALFWAQKTGQYEVWEYRWDHKVIDSDPFKPDPTSKGSWNDADRKASQPKRGIVGGELLYLGNHLLLHWVPRDGGGAHFQLWRLTPTSKTDPATQLLTEGDWQSFGAKEQQLVYLGGDLVLVWRPVGVGDHRQTHGFFEVFKLNRAARGSADPLPTFVANGNFASIGEAHELYYIGRDRMLVWERAKKVHDEEPNKQAASRFRVFRVDRGVKNAAQILPDPAVAEGLWHTIFVSSGEEHRLIPIGDGDRLRMIDIVAATSPGGRKVRIWPIKNDIPEVTGIPGVSLRRRGKVVRVAVIPRKLMAARNGGVEKANVGPKISELADELRLSPLQTFRELVGFAENGKPTQALYKSIFTESGYPGKVKAAAQLTRVGMGGSANGRYGYGHQHEFHDWHVDPNHEIEFSLSPGFRTEVLDAGVKKQQVELRLKMAQPHFDALKAKVEALELAILPLNSAANVLASALEPAFQDLGLLNALDALLGLMRARPVAGKSFDDAKVLKLKGLVQELIVEHQKHLIVDPKHLQERKLDRDKAANKVLGMIEEEAFLNELRVFAENVDLTKTSFERLVLDTIRNAYELLLVSNQAEHVLEKHVRPALMSAASLLKLQGLTGGNPDFDQALSEAIPLPSKPSALQILASRTAPAGSAVGNIPGPPTLAVVIFHIAAPALARAATNVKDAVRLGAFTMRALAFCANLSPKQTQLAMGAVGKSDLKLVKSIDWAEKFQAGPAATAAVGLLNLVALLALLTDDEELTKKKVFALLGSASGLGAASVQFAQAFMRAMTVGRLGAVANFTGKTLGTVAGFVSAGLGAVQALEEHRSGDELGFWLAAAGASGAYVTASAFLVAGGLSSATPAGVVLITIGLVVGLGAGILQVWRDIFTNATHTVVEAMVSQYGRSSEEAGFGPYAFAHDKPGAGPLKAAYEAVKAAHHPGITGFLPFVDPDPRPGDPSSNLKKPALKDGGVEMLYDAGFDLKAIEIIVDDDKANFVMKRLLERRDWPLRRNKQK